MSRSQVQRAAGGGGWRQTSALLRSSVVAAAALVVAVITAAPELVVVATPFALHAALAVRGRPASTPRAWSRLEHTTLHEGQATRLLLSLDDAGGAEHVTRVAEPGPHVAVVPALGAVGADAADRSGGPVPELVVSPLRWGARSPGVERVALTSPWSGYIWGPIVLDTGRAWVVPVGATYDSRGEAPHPLGLVGAHRSRRAGGGTEFAGIRPFAPGDRLRRIHWPVSLRQDELHVVTTSAEEDAGVLLVVDALADLGRSGGVGGAPSSLDQAVRASAALAEHHLRLGDRVGLRVLGPVGREVAMGAGLRHHRRILDTLARVAPQDVDLGDGPIPLGVRGGTVVHFLSPMLHEAVVATAAALVRRGVPVVVVDTLVEQHDHDDALSARAWRMRMLHRDALLVRLAAVGCPVVPWAGPGSLDDVLRRLSRRARLPQWGPR